MHNLTITSGTLPAFWQPISFLPITGHKLADKLVTSTNNKYGIIFWELAAAPTEILTCSSQFYPATSIVSYQCLLSPPHTHTPSWDTCTKQGDKNKPSQKWKAIWIPILENESRIVKSNRLKIHIPPNIATCCQLSVLIAVFGNKAK